MNLPGPYTITLTLFTFPPYSLLSHTSPHLTSPHFSVSLPATVKLTSLSGLLSLFLLITSYNVIYFAFDLHSLSTPTLLSPTHTRSPLFKLVTHQQQSKDSPFPNRSSEVASSCSINQHILQHFFINNNGCESL